MSVTRSLSITGLFFSFLRDRRNEECKVASQANSCAAWVSVGNTVSEIGFGLNHEVVLKKGRGILAEYTRILLRSTEKIRGDLEPQRMQWQSPDLGRRHVC